MPTRRTKLYIQCNPLLDITAAVDESFLKSYNLEANDVYVYGAQFRGLFDALERQAGAHLSPGGAGLNVARVAQWVLQGPDQTGCVAYVGCVGADEHGDLLRRAAEKDRVHMILEVTENAPTGRCAVCIHGNLRSLVGDAAAANSLTIAHLNSPVVATAIEQAAVVYTTAYAVPFHTEHVKMLAARSRIHSRRTLFAMDLSAHSVLEMFGEDLVDLLEKLDFIFCNDKELRNLAMMLQWLPDEKSDEELVREVAQKMMYDHHAVRCVVVTRGAASTLYATSTGEEGSVDVVPLDNDTVIPISTGAGDAFVGGFLAAFTDGKDLPSCCRVGSDAAAFVIKHSIKDLIPELAPRL